MIWNSGDVGEEGVGRVDVSDFYGILLQRFFVREAESTGRRPRGESIKGELK